MKLRLTHLRLFLTVGLDEEEEEEEEEETKAEKRREEKIREGEEMRRTKGRQEDRYHGPFRGQFNKLRPIIQ